MLILRVCAAQTIIKSTSVTFPEGKDVPKVSDKAREFIRKALAYTCSRSECACARGARERRRRKWWWWWWRRRRRRKGYSKLTQ